MAKPEQPRRWREGHMRVNCTRGSVIIHNAPPGCAIALRRDVSEGAALVFIGDVAPERANLTPHDGYTIVIGEQGAWVSGDDARCERTLTIAKGRYRVHADTSQWPSALWLEMIDDETPKPPGLTVRTPEGSWRVELEEPYEGETRTMDAMRGVRAGVEFIIEPGASIVCEAPGHPPWTVRGRSPYTWFEIVRTRTGTLLAVRHPNDKGADGGPRLAATQSDEP